MRCTYRPSRTHGFTLLEVMLVLLLMGLAAGYVMFNAFGASKTDLLKSQASRLQVLTDMASDYAVLNQQQLGLRIEEQDSQYVFLYLDEDDEWQRIEDEEIYEPHTLPEPFTFTLNLDNLPWDSEDRLFDREIFDEGLSVSDDAVEIGEDEQQVKPPQILIMSSGEITPFTLTFNFDGGFDEAPVYFTLSNRDMPPLALDGPLDQSPL